MTNEHNFKVGDKVTLANDTNAVGIIRYVGKEMCIVDFGMGDSTVGYKDIQPLDRRTAFLTRLRSLLREFDAEIGDSGIRFLKGMEITFGTDTPRIRYNHCTINADNILDFDKE